MDLSMRVAGASDTSAVRATFIIEDMGVPRAMACCPMSNGRSMVEFPRLAAALQVSGKHGAATPAGWQPGDRAIAPPPQTTAATGQRIRKGHEGAGWFPAPGHSDPGCGRDRDSGCGFRSRDRATGRPLPARVGEGRGLADYGRPGCCQVAGAASTTVLRPRALAA